MIFEKFMKALLLSAVLVACGNETNKVDEGSRAPIELQESDLLTLCTSDPSELTQEVADQCSSLATQLASKQKFDQADGIFERDGKSRWTLTSLETRNTQIVLSDNEQLNKLARVLSNDMSECGVSLNGSLCLDRQVEKKIDLGEYINASNEVVYMVELKYLGVEAPLIYIFNQQENEKGELYPKTLEVKVKGREIFKDESVREFVESQFAPTVVTADLVKVENKKYDLNLSKFKTIRPLYHHLLGVAATNNFGGFINANRTKLINQIKTKIDLIKKANNDLYQFSLLALINEGFRFDEPFFYDLCDHFVKAENDLLKQYAAINLYKRNSSKRELRPHIVAALSHPYTNARMEALNLIKRGFRQTVLAEKNAVIALIADKDESIRSNATRFVTRMNIDDRNIPTIEKASKSEVRQVRETVVVLLAKANTSKSSMLLAKLSSDVEDSVRKPALRALRNRKITSQFVRPLGKALNIEHSATQLAAIKLLVKSNSYGALSVLNDRLIIESNFLVKYQIETAIKTLRSKLR